MGKRSEKPKKLQKKQPLEDAQGAPQREAKKFGTG